MSETARSRLMQHPGSVEYAKNMTDEQWLGLIEIVNDDAEARVTFPRERGAMLEVVRGGLRISIAADGERKTWP